MRKFILVWVASIIGSLLNASSVELINPKVVLITGSASGFGKATAIKLIKKGYIVYGGDIQIEKNKYLDSIGGYSLYMDVRIDSLVNEGVAKIIKAHGTIDILINNAGYGSYGSIENIPIEELKNQFDVNVFGYARLQKAVLPYMRKQRSGKIINVSSVVGYISGPFAGWYAATKHAIEAMSDALRLEVKEFNIDVVKINPGVVNTNFNEVALEKISEVNIADDYKALKEDFVLVMKDNYANAEGPENTANCIVKAVDAKNPKRVYKTTKDAKKIIFADHIFTAKQMDKLILKNLRKSAKKVRAKQVK